MESRREAEGAQLAPPVQPVHPDVKMQRLPFYDVYDELIKPTTLGRCGAAGGCWLVAAVGQSLVNRWPSVGQP